MEVPPAAPGPVDDGRVGEEGRDLGKVVVNVPLLLDAAVVAAVATAVVVIIVVVVASAVEVLQD